MMSDVHEISGVLGKEEGLRGANSGERQVGLKAGFTPAVPQPCHLPSASQRGRGEGRVPRRGTSVPPANFTVHRMRDVHPNPGAPREVSRPRGEKFTL